MVANTWYGLKITGVKKDTSVQLPGAYNKIEMYTRYDATKELYIDLNPTFTVFSFAAAPSELDVAIAFGETAATTDDVRKKFASEYIMNMTFTPTKNLTKGIAYLVELPTTSGFFFQGNLRFKKLISPS